jgi:hypothetical protein
VIGGPVGSAGYWWYRVALVGRTSSEGYAEGWVAAGDRDGAPWLVRRPKSSATPGDARWSSAGNGNPGTEEHLQLDAGTYRLIFTGLARCSYLVSFGQDLEWKLGFDGSTLSTVNWPQSYPEPSSAPETPQDGVFFPPLPAGDYHLLVEDRGSTARACPWELEIKP